MLKWLFFGLIIFLLYRWSLRLPKYTDPVSVEHLMEVSSNLGRVLAAATRHIGKQQPQHPFSAGTGCTTSGRVNILYTITKSDPEKYEHHISITSSSANSLGSDVAGFVAAAIGRIIGEPGKRAVLARASSGAFILIVPFSAEEHDKLVRHGIVQVEGDTARKMYQGVMDDRERLVKNLAKLDVKVAKS